VLREIGGASADETAGTKKRRLDELKQTSPMRCRSPLGLPSTLERNILSFLPEVDLCRMDSLSSGMSCLLKSHFALRREFSADIWDGSLKGYQGTVLRLLSSCHRLRRLELSHLSSTAWDALCCWRACAIIALNASTLEQPEWLFHAAHGGVAGKLSALDQL
jgi:hypothetical protein